MPSSREVTEKITAMYAGTFALAGAWDEGLAGMPLAQGSLKKSPRFLEYLLHHRIRQRTNEICPATPPIQALELIR